MSLRSSLGKVKGLGSAKEGVHHWRLQRLTAIALIPLTLWFVVSLLCKVQADHATVAAWVSVRVAARAQHCALLAFDAGRAGRHRGLHPLHDQTNYGPTSVARLRRPRCPARRGLHPENLAGNALIHG